MSRTSFLSPFARTTTRLVAGVSALLLAAAGLTVLTATAAHAESNSNAYVTISVDVSSGPMRYTTDTELSFTITVTSLTAFDCDVDKPHLNWSDSTQAHGVETVASTWTVPVGKQAAGDYTFYGTVFPQEGCNDPGGQISASKTIEIMPVTRTATGSALRGNVPASSSSDYDTVEGVTVDLLTVAGGPGATPVDSTQTGVDGSYSLTAPTATEEQDGREYKIRFTYPDSTVVYYDGNPNAWISSTSDWDEADTTVPTDWVSTDPYSALITSAPAPSQTNQDRFCATNFDSEYTDFTTSAVWWDGICETDPSLSDAETRGVDQHYNALDDFGYIWFEQNTGSYDVTADTFETSVTDGVLTTVLHDNDIVLPEAGRTVDVTVTRTFDGSFARWAVEVRDADTGEIVDIPFSFGGELGSDDDTVWTGSGSWRVSDDNANTLIDDGDPILAHQVTASSFDWDTEDGYGYPELEVYGGQLTYTLAVIDYTDCVGSTARAAASTIAQAMPGNFGADLAPLAGDACPTTWVPTPVFDEVTAGVFFEQTFPIPSPLNWSLGGWAAVDGLPSGLDYEALNEGAPGTAPTIRIYGTPEVEGDYSLLFRAWGDGTFQDNQDAVKVSLTILPGDGPSMTKESRICDADYSSAPHRDFTTTSVYWENACETDPSIDDAETLGHDRGDALDAFGYVIFDQGPVFGPNPYSYYVTADSYTSSIVDGALTTVIHDNDVVLPDDSSVDVTVTRTIKGSFVRWVVEVRDSGTGAVADVPFTFGGDLGSDEDTVWNSSGNRLVSDDDGYGDPVLAHYAAAGTGGSLQWVDEDGNSLDDGDGSVFVEVDGGILTYDLAVIDYGFCDQDGLRGAAAGIAEAMPGIFGQDVSIAGDCNSGWPLPAVNEMRVGTPFDQTFTVESTALDWEFGGTASLDNLPDGLEWEVVAGSEWVDDTAPQVRIFGTPTAVGPFSIAFDATDDWDDWDAIELIGTVLGPVQTSILQLNFDVGDEADGSTVTVGGTGLEEGSSYSVIVQSTPQTIGSGTIGADFLLNDTATLPSNLEAGWHSVTLAGTFFDGSALSSVLWFQVGADGTVLAISPTAPAVPDPGTDPGTTPGVTPGGLASSGVDVAGGLALTLSLLLLGGLLVMLWRRRAAAP